MTTVPKLSYAVRNKSKSKNSEGETQTPQEASSDLFSHMNQDNLNYIKDQIKQKQKFKKHQSAKTDSPQHQSPMPLSPEIQEKDEQLEETQRQYIPQEVQQPPSQPKIQKSQAETNKISFYNLVSQAKSKRVSSMEGYFEEGQHHNDEKRFGLIGFLQTYINELNEKKSKPLKRYNNQENLSKNHKQILISKYKEEKNKTYILATELEKSKAIERDNSMKIQHLETIIQDMAVNMGQLRKEIEEIKEERKYGGMRVQKMNKGQTNKLSYRGNNEEESLSRFLKKTKSQTEDIMQLEKQLRAFEDTGEIQLRKNYDHWYGS